MQLVPKYCAKLQRVIIFALWTFNFFFQVSRLYSRSILIRSFRNTSKTPTDLLSFNFLSHFFDYLFLNFQKIIKFQFNKFKKNPIGPIKQISLIILLLQMNAVLGTLELNPNKNLAYGQEEHKKAQRRKIALCNGTFLCC